MGVQQVLDEKTFTSEDKMGDAEWTCNHRGHQDRLGWASGRHYNPIPDNKNVMESGLVKRQLVRIHIPPALNLLCTT
ncbi:hypothetical protein ZIOFF_009276 [Zingiber officinale]|uniref:Uncharacterized protein n=1 Tax=Zingiber officinale TaxID=94328 RepID=A0A8J5HX73_ZINOF|nr:hypothetical protein ZIOFF_009276 [Zingiber officinale]